MSRDTTFKVKSSEVPGRMIKLSTGNLVFVGRNPNYPDYLFVAMKNDNKIDTYFALSAEAAVALSVLLNNPDAGHEVISFPFTLRKVIERWEYVPEPTDAR